MTRRPPPDGWRPLVAPYPWRDDPAFLGAWERIGDEALTAILTRTVTCGYHLSIARPERLPSWEDVRDARYAMVPDDHAMAMVLPPIAEYVNVHDFCFQLIEVHGEVRLRGDRWTTAGDPAGAATTPRRAGSPTPGKGTP